MKSQVSNLPFWRDSFGLAFVVFTFFSFYLFFATRNFHVVDLNNAVAATAAFMIGLSFALSGFCYYFDFLDKKIIYRKYFGLTGYWLALVYSVLLLLLDPAKYLQDFPKSLITTESYFGLTAMAILTFMAVISNTWAMKWLGPQNWRRGLRLGYIAYALLVARAYILEKDLWTAWLQNLDGMPPLRLILAVFAVGVILFRLSVIVAKLLRRKSNQQFATGG